MLIYAFSYGDYSPDTTILKMIAFPNPLTALQSIDYTALFWHDWLLALEKSRYCWRM